jgi:hypothetical protein
LHPLRNNYTKLGKMAAQRIDQHGPLTDQQISRAVQHQNRLLLDALDRDKPHIWPHDCFADRFGIHCVVLTALYKQID